MPLPLFPSRVVVVVAATAFTTEWTLQNHVTHSAPKQEQTMDFIHQPLSVPKKKSTPSGVQAPALLSAKIS